MTVNETNTAAGIEDVAARMDALPVTALHIAATALCAAGFMFDLMEISFGSVLSAVFSSAPYNVPSGQLSMLLSSVYVGAVVGAPALGWWADRHGRRGALDHVTRHRRLPPRRAPARSGVV